MHEERERWRKMSRDGGRTAHLEEKRTRRKIASEKKRERGACPLHSLMREKKKKRTRTYSVRGLY